MNKTDLRLDWCSFHAAKYACENWHYSKSIPAAPRIMIGVWEDKIFIGCVIFSRGASSNIGKSFNLPQTECCELTRIALTQHLTPVSRIISIALKLFSTM